MAKLLIEQALSAYDLWTSDLILINVWNWYIWRLCVVHYVYMWLVYYRYNPFLLSIAITIMLPLLYRSLILRICRKSCRSLFLHQSSKQTKQREKQHINEAKEEKIVVSIIILPSITLVLSNMCIKLLSKCSIYSFYIPTYVLCRVAMQ